MITSTPSRGLVLLLGIAVGVLAANLYYAQPLVALIASSLHMRPETAGLVVTLIQVGYGVGVLFVVPLGDLIENRKLILTTIAISFVALIGLTFATKPMPYFFAAILLGLGTSGLQVIVPYVSHMVPENLRGVTVGRLMSGLMLGIMLSRPMAGFITDLISWHAVFLISAAMMVAIWFALARVLPYRHPRTTKITYFGLISSLLGLYLRVSVVRRRAIYQGFMFAAFCLFWTASPLLLASPAFHMSQTQIALFALVGVGGAVSAPIAGRFADLGYSRWGTALSMWAGAMAFLMSRFGTQGSWFSLAMLVAAALLLDAGVTANLVLGQRAIFSLRAKYRSRFNGLYIATIFVGGALGSYVGVWSFERGGWELTAMVGASLPSLAFIYFLTEWLTGFQKQRR